MSTNCPNGGGSCPPRPVRLCVLGRDVFSRGVYNWSIGMTNRKDNGPDNFEGDVLFSERIDCPFIGDDDTKAALIGEEVWGQLHKNIIWKE